MNSVYRNIFLAMLAVATLAPAATQADTRFGIRAGSYTDTDEPFIGAELLAPVSNQLYVNPNVEYVFVEYGDFLTANLDFHYDVPTRSSLFFWLGGGPALGYFNFPGDLDSEVEFGVNLLAGIGIETRGRLIPYIQAKAVVGDIEDVVLAVGLRF